MIDGKYEYFAFISYKREDEKWAKWLQSKLEHFHLPATLNGKELPKNLRPVFRDTDELSAGNLPKQIYNALSISKNLIVVCSPRSAQSEWVDKEINDFIAIKGGISDDIFPFIVEGTPYASNPNKECFPDALRSLPNNEERLGGNINEQGGRDAAVVKIISGILGISFDSLWQKHEREQKRKRTAMVIMSLLFAFVCLFICSYIVKQNQEILDRNHKLEINNLSQSLYLIELDINKGENLESFVKLKLIRKNNENLIKRSGLINKVNDLENLCVTNIKRYPLKIKEIIINDLDENSKQNDDSDDFSDSICYYQVLKSDICDIIYYNQEGEIFINNKLHKKDTTFYIESKFKITQDENYLVYSNGENTLYFYDIVNNKFISKYKSQDLFVWVPSMGGVIDVSYDNTKVLYHELSRGSEEDFIIDLLNNKKIIDDIPTSFPLLSPNGKYLLDNDNSLIIKKIINNKELCNINDSIFYDAQWRENNLIKAVKGNITTIWEIDEDNTPDFIELNPQINNSKALYVECSNDGRYLAVITDTYLYIWDIISGVNICKHEHGVYYPNCLVFSKDSKKIAYVGIHGSGELYSITDKSYKSLYLADVFSNAGDNFVLDFIFNDEVLITSTFDKLNFCNSVYSLVLDSIVVENHKILKINNNSIIFDNSKYTSDGICISQNLNQDTLLVYDNDMKKLCSFVSGEKSQYNEGFPFHSYNPTWLEFSEDGWLHANNATSYICSDGWYEAKIKQDTVNTATRYLRDSLYRIEVVDSKIFISKQNLLDKFTLD